MPAWDAAVTWPSPSDTHAPLSCTRCPCPPASCAQGYQFYLIIFYILVAILFVSVAICVWVGWCFMNDNFPFLWPIKVARVVVSLFVSMFYIASLNIFLMACACDKKPNGKWKHLVFKLGEQLLGTAARALSKAALVAVRHSRSHRLCAALCPATLPTDCLSFPHLIHAIMSLTSGAIFFVVAVLLVRGRC